MPSVDVTNGPPTGHVYWSVCRSFRRNGRFRIRPYAPRGPRPFRRQFLAGGSMTRLGLRQHLRAMLIVLLPLAPAFSQALTGTITGRALDSSGGVLPGVDVSISSPAMIGGARTAVTDDQGVYRF